MSWDPLGRVRLTLVIALRSLRLHKLRSLLTVLGLVFGVASVIAMLAIAEGASAEAQRQIQELGATNIIVRSQKPSEETKQDSNERNFVLIYGLTYDDFERLNETLPTVVRTTPLREFRQNVRYLDKELEGRVVGVTPEYLAMNNLELTEGRFISELDLSEFQNVVVIGHELAEKLFPYDDPINKSIRLGENHYYHVIGVTGYKAPSAGAGSSLAGQEFNKDAYIPLSTDRVRFGEMIAFSKEGSFSYEKIELSQITVAVSDMSVVKKTAEVIEGLLDQFHPRKDFTVTVPLELLEKAEATKRIFNLVLGSIASISLLVGGIGIMNIMLATVTERTREIGIHRALGAKRRDITLQFLVETAVLSVTGGLLGIALGLAVPPLVARVSGMPAILSPWTVVLAFSIAVFVGVGFGVYPARRAALLDPIEALRAE
jgi:putative ABC transport system permease protein